MADILHQPWQISPAIVLVIELANNANTGVSDQTETAYVEGKKSDASSAQIKEIRKAITKLKAEIKDLANWLLKKDRTISEQGGKEERALLCLPSIEINLCRSAENARQWLSSLALLFTCFHAIVF